VDNDECGRQVVGSWHVGLNNYRIAEFGIRGGVMTFVSEWANLVNLHVDFNGEFLSALPHCVWPSNLWIFLKSLSGRRSD